MCISACVHAVYVLICAGSFCNAIHLLSVYESMMSFAVSGAWYGACVSTGNVTSTTTALRGDSEHPVEFHPRAKERLRSMAAQEEETAGALKTVQYTWRGLRMVGEASLFDMAEPVWHPDEKSPACDQCHAQFSLLIRRHHCRRCGDVVCGDCCEKNSLSRMGYVDPVLICSKCLPIVRSEEEFLSTQVQHLVHGAHFHLSDTHDQTVYHCKLSNDHKQLIISNDHFPINMKHILEVKTISAEEPAEEGTRKRSGSSQKHIGLEVTYKAGGGEHKLSLLPAPSHSRKQATEWLRALKKGLIILHK